MDIIMLCGNVIKMDKDTKMLLIAVVIILVALVSFNLSNLTGKITEEECNEKGEWYYWYNGVCPKRECITKEEKIYTSDEITEVVEFYNRESGFENKDIVDFDLISVIYTDFIYKKCGEDYCKENIHVICKPIFTFEDSNNTKGYGMASGNSRIYDILIRKEKSPFWDEPDMDVLHIYSNVGAEGYMDEHFFHYKLNLTYKEFEIEKVEVCE